MKRAFTLLEVNLAILVMAGGILSIVILYSLGYRESAQSREDVASAAYADAVLGPLAMALSSTELQWQTFDQIESNPREGWGAYLKDDGEIVSSPESTAQGVYGQLMSKLGSSGISASWPSSSGFDNLHAGLVVIRDSYSGVVKLGFRASKKTGMLMSAPLYFTEVHFQGEQQDKTEVSK